MCIGGRVWKSIILLVFFLVKIPSISAQPEADVKCAQAPEGLEKVANPLVATFYIGRSSLGREHNIRDQGGVPEVIFFELDMTGDGCQDFLSTANFMYTGQTENIWTLFINDGDSYVLARQPLVFNADAFRVIERDNDTPVILSYARGGPEMGVVIQHEWKNQRIVEKKVAEISFSRDAASTLYHVLIDQKTHVERVPWSKVEAMASASRGDTKGGEESSLQDEHETTPADDADQ